jgi:hypothetical protein
MTEDDAIDCRVGIRVLLIVATVTVLGSVSVAHADPHRLTLAGEVQAASGTRSASLRLFCEPAANGVVSVELWVPQAFTLKDFDYDHFEGPDAEAGARELSYLTVSGAAGTAEVTHAAAGWYSGEDPDAFVFGVSERSHKPARIAAFLRAIAPEHTQLVWVQRGFADPHQALRATFNLDAATIASIRTTVEPCLPPAPKSRPKKAK